MEGAFKLKIRTISIEKEVNKMGYMLFLLRNLRFIYFLTQKKISHWSTVQVSYNLQIHKNSISLDSVLTKTSL